MLRIVYFKNKLVPVKDYINNIFDKSEELIKKGKHSQGKRLNRLGIRILALIEHTAENNGIVSMPNGRKLHHYPFYELRQKVSKNLIRIFYFVQDEKDLVLLHAYNKKEESSTPKKELEQANQNYKLYISNPLKHVYL